MGVVLHKLKLLTIFLFGTTEKNLQWLQHVQNNLARVILQSLMSASATDLRHELHWLPVRHSVDFKLATPTFKAKQFGQPVYLLHEYQP